VTQKRPVAILGNIAQQNMHVGYDLDKGTVGIYQIGIPAT
jgi:hypothetical protein